VKDRPTANPPNRFHDVELTYDEGDGPPPASVTLIDDHSRSILSENDSPDVGFRWSVNPYRGCQTACAYCVDGETPILLGDGRTRRMRELAVGDEVYGTKKLAEKYRYYTRTRVLAAWTTVKPAYRLELSDGTSLVASGDHRFLSNRGWKYVTGAECGPKQRPHLTTNNNLLGTGRFAIPPDDTESYRRGYLCGIIRGDGHPRRAEYRRPSTGRIHLLHQFRLALVDLEALLRTRRYLADLDVATYEFAFQAVHGNYKAMRALRGGSRGSFERITELVAWPASPDLDWHKGFLAGIFDAEGSHHESALRIANTNTDIIERVARSLARLRFDAIVETHVREPRPLSSLRIRGGLAERLRFFHTTNPAITRKWDLEGVAIKSITNRKLVSITSIGTRVLYDITTGTGDFVANGVISHNCYARPTHEYLDLGAGTDFDTKIVVKRDAPALLRAAFDKPSWKGELVMFSGVTDCYQPTERDLELTKGCLEVCLEYRNPVSIISKHALVERDVELIAELAKQASATLSVSLAWTDAELARQIEPWAPAPERRLKVIETFARAGVRVGVMCAPIIPGLNDNQLVKLLERAAAAGATHAGWVLLRLPGAVATVFPDRLRAAMPLAADKVLHRIRETRGGDRMYDSRFHTRGRGEGVYAQTIAQLFDTTVARLGLNRREDTTDVPSTFRRPDRSNQLKLF
jgi:DNA repair photolyase